MKKECEQLHDWLFGTPQHSREEDIAKIQDFAFCILKDVAQLAMLACSNPHLTAEQYRTALADICTLALARVEGDSTSLHGVQAAE